MVFGVGSSESDLDLEDQKFAGVAGERFGENVVDGGIEIEI